MKFEFSRPKVVQKENLLREGKVQITGPHLLTAGYSIQSGFNMHIQSQLLQHTPVTGTHSSYQLGYVSSTDG